MCVLSDIDIKRAIAYGDITVTPMVEDSCIQPNSIDLTLDNEFVKFITLNDDPPVINPLKKADYDKIMTSVFEVDEIIIEPGEFMLASTAERIKLSNHVAATIEGKSSLARLGIQIHQTGGWIDAGFEGQITLEIGNIFPYPIKLTAGMPIAQIVFFRAETPCKVGYIGRPSAKYKYQTGAQTSQYFRNDARVDVEEEGNTHRFMIKYGGEK